MCEWSIIDEKGPLLSQLQFDIWPHLPTEGACSLTIVLLSRSLPVVVAVDMTTSEVDPRLSGRC